MAWTREKWREYARQYYADNLEASRAYHAAYRAKTKERRAAQRAEKYWANRDHYLRYQRASKLKNCYGLTIEQYEQMAAAQNGVCAICQKPSTDGKRLHVDHCHSTGVIRGLLCNKCNPAIGSLGDTPEMLERAIAYLRGTAT